MNNYVTLKETVYSMWAVHASLPGVHVWTLDPFSVFHFQVGKTHGGPFSTPLSLTRVLSVTSLLSGHSGVYPFPSSGQMFLFPMMRPICLCISQVSTFPLMLRAEYIPQMALATVPKSFICYS